MNFVEIMAQWQTGTRFYKLHLCKMDEIFFLCQGKIKSIDKMKMMKPNQDTQRRRSELFV